MHSPAHAFRSASPQKTQRAGYFAGVWAFAVAGGLALFYLLTSLYIAANRVFWFDELFTVHIARLAKVGTVWAALANGVDALPPPYYLLVRVFDSIFGPSDVSARVPSAIALFIGLLVIFDCTRRLTDGLHGLIALSVATCSFLPYYGYEARSYAIYFMLAAVSFWAWNYNGERQNLATFLFGASFFAGVCFHYYFAMCLLPYLLWEMLRWKLGHRPSSDLLAGVAGAVIPVVLLSPFALAFSRKFAGGYWNRPTFLELRSIFGQLFPDGLLLLAMIMLWVVIAGWEKRQEPSIAMQSAEATGWLFLLIPLAAYFVAVTITNAFYSRYFIGVIPGVAVAFAISLYRYFRKAAEVSLGIFLLLAGWGVAQQMTVVHHPDKVEATGIRSFLQVEDTLQLEGKRYFVFSQPLLFLEAQHYSAHPEQCVLFLPSDFDRPVQNGPDPYLHQRLELNLSQYYPMQFWTIDDLRRHQADSALVEPDEKTLEDLHAAGIQAGRRFSTPLLVDYLR